MLFVLLIVIDFEIKILISRNNLFQLMLPTGAKKGRGYLKANLSSYHVKYVLKLGNLGPCHQWPPMATS